MAVTFDFHFFFYIDKAFNVIYDPSKLPILIYGVMDSAVVKNYKAKQTISYVLI